VAYSQGRGGSPRGRIVPREGEVVSRRRVPCSYDQETLKKKVKSIHIAVRVSETTPAAKRGGKRESSSEKKCREKGACLFEKKWGASQAGGEESLLIGKKRRFSSSFQKKRKDGKEICMVSLSEGRKQCGMGARTSEGREKKQRDKTYSKDCTPP